MARPILMPQVGQDLTEGIVTAIHVKLGDQVKKGDIVAEVESEKAAFEVEAFETGTVLKIHYKVGDMAVVLEPLMMVGTAAEAGETAASAKADEEASGAEPQATIVDVGEKIPPAEPACATAGSDRVRSSPLARRLSSQAGVDLASISGTGPHAAVVKRDVEAFLCNLAPVDDAALPLPRREASPAGLASLKTLQAGTGDPVLFIHGFGSELSAWRPFIAQLGLGNPILAIDLPGHGGAAGVGTMNFEDLVASVRVALAKDRVEHLHLVGHSLGAAVAIAIAGGDDLDVRSLTLIAPAGLGPKINGDFIAGFVASASEVSLKVWMDLLVSDPAKLPGVLVRATLSGREGTAMAENQSRLAAGIFSGNTQLVSVREALNRYLGPVRAIVGREDRIIPFDQLDDLPAQVALHRLPRVGHLPQLEAASLVGLLVTQTVRSAL